MPKLLQVRPFTADLLGEVQDFECGAAPWETNVANWIKDGRRALRQIERGRCRVWLYYTDDGELVGYASLGPYDWEWPHLDSPPRTTNHIPYLGVASRFHGQPADVPPEWQYSSQIIRHLIGEAIRETQEHPGRVPIIGLYVEPENQRAVGFYRRLGFQAYEKQFVDKGTAYVAMFRRLPTMI